jgi:hypothetical protein
MAMSTKMGDNKINPISATTKSKMRLTRQFALLLKELKKSASIFCVFLRRDNKRIMPASLFA